MFIVSAAGGEPKTVYDKQGACKPHWSPDGKRLVYETEAHLYTIGPDGKKNRPVTWFGGVHATAVSRRTGNRSSTAKANRIAGSWELYSIPVQGGTPVKLTEGGSDMTPDEK